MVQFKILPSTIALSMHSILTVGKAPGCAVQIGHICVFGSKFTKSCTFAQRQKSLFGVDSFTCISSQIVVFMVYFVILLFVIKLAWLSILNQYIYYNDCLISLAGDRYSSLVTDGGW